MPSLLLRAPSHTLSTRLPVRPAAALVLVFLATLLVTACGSPGGNSAEGTEASMASRADFQLASLSGEELGPTDYPGKTVLVDFWATWCVPCHAQAEVLKQVYPKVGDKVQFLAVDVGEEETQVRGFVERKPFPYPVLLDPRSEVADSLGVYSLPTLMIIDPRGEVSYFEAGVLAEEALCRALTEADRTITC